MPLDATARPTWPLPRRYDSIISATYVLPQPPGASKKTRSPRCSSSASRTASHASRWLGWCVGSLWATKASSYCFFDRSSLAKAGARMLAAAPAPTTATAGSPRKSIGAPSAPVDARGNGSAKFVRRRPIPISRRSIYSSTYRRVPASVAYKSRP
ncbi:hypothetical protein BU14_0169s0017 [Porphyra umbilicalis]|uniref:Uncharacterized protein n=1 Tax=Porphyra umbilicalis TaxID=2786 RepID=A0A1X6P833_PORUM|nr:hypothetical protein BU14_0169s0017 [Porphyra umbilicalis]|eukprot:OSX76916.1 hypothetical protein BU14_0169s0017 [Porphyra umbilicalis]